MPILNLKRSYIKVQSTKTWNKGFTLIEVIVSLSIFLIIMAIGFNFFLRTQTLVQLAESEAKMQMYARQAMTILAKELRQATDYKEFLEDDVPEAKTIFFVRPSTTAGQYTFVRYWYKKNSQGIYSLFRAEQPNGTSTLTPTDYLSFEPDPYSATDKATYKITPLIKEATVIDPGKQSYFSQNPLNKKVIEIILITATYGYTKGALSSELEVKRQFRIETSVTARNMNAS